MIKIWNIFKNLLEEADEDEIVTNKKVGKYNEMMTDIGLVLFSLDY